MYQNIKDWEKYKVFLKKESQNIDKDIFQEVQKNIEDLQVTTIRRKREYVEVLSSLIEVNSPEINTQKHWEELWIAYNHKVKAAKEKIWTLEEKNKNLKEQIIEKQIAIENKTKELKNEEKKRLEFKIEIKAITEKIEKNKERIKNKRSELVKESNTHFVESESQINAISDIIIDLFHEFKKNNNQQLKNEFDFLFKIKEQINIFLNKYFIAKETIFQPISIMENYDADLKTIINDFIEFYGENKYHQILEHIKSFSNKKESKSEQEYQPSTSNVITTTTVENNSNVKLFDFEKLALKQGSVIHLIANYQYFLEEYKKPCSYLVVIQNNSLNKENSKKIANNFYFAKMLLLAECNPEEQKIFDELKELQNKIIIKKNKNNVFTKNKNRTFGLLYIPQNSIFEKNMQFLIDFTTLINIPKKFISLIHDYKKICDLDEKIFKKVANNFKQKIKKNYQFTFLNLKIQNNNVKSYIKDLDLLYANIYQQNANLDCLLSDFNHLFSDFSEFLYWNRENINQNLNKNEKWYGKELQKMIKSISNILTKTLDLMKADCTTIENSKNILQEFDTKVMNKEPLLSIVSVANKRIVFIK